MAGIRFGSMRAGIVARLILAVVQPDSAQGGEHKEPEEDVERQVNPRN